MIHNSKGNPEEHTIYEFAEIIKKEVGMSIAFSSMSWVKKVKLLLLNRRNF